MLAIYITSDLIQLSILLFQQDLTGNHGPWGAGQEVVSVPWEGGKEKREEDSERGLEKNHIQHHHYFGLNYWIILGMVSGFNTAALSHLSSSLDFVSRRCGFCCFCHCCFNECQQWSLSPKNNLQADILLTTSINGGYRFPGFICATAAYNARVHKGEECLTAYFWHLKISFDNIDCSELNTHQTTLIRVSLVVLRGSLIQWKEMWAPDSQQLVPPPILHWICSVTLSILLKLPGTEQHL